MRRGTARWRPRALPGRTKTAAPDRRGPHPAEAPSDGAGAAGRRLFIAVPVPPGVRGRVERIVDRARAASDDPRAVRWVGPDGLHLTLRFLGSTPEERVGAAAAAVEEAARSAVEFDLGIGGNGAFPGGISPRVLWLRIDVGEPALDELARSLDGALAARGWSSDPRRFRAHLTVARCEGPRAGRSAAAALSEAAAGLRLRWRADSLVLYESHLGRGPARYEVIAEERLGG